MHYLAWIWQSKSISQIKCIMDLLSMPKLPSHIYLPNVRMGGIRGSPSSVSIILISSFWSNIFLARFAYSSFVNV